MIHMLSRFNLKDGVDVDVFAKAYARFAEAMKGKGLLVGTSALGYRLSDTPMDTDASGAPHYYSVMTFCDRSQLDAAYAYLLKPSEAGDEIDEHNFVKRSSQAPIFTCWQDLS